MTTSKPQGGPVWTGREQRKRTAQTTVTDFGARLALRPPPVDEPDQAWCWQADRREAKP
jgi:hypothetical protein